MNTLDILSIFLIMALFIITTCCIFITYYFIQALKSLTNLTVNLDETAQNIKNKVQMRALAAVPGILLALVGKIIKKRG